MSFDKEQFARDGGSWAGCSSDPEWRQYNDPGKKYGHWHETKNYFPITDDSSSSSSSSTVSSSPYPSRTYTSEEKKKIIIHTLIKFGAIAAVITLPLTGPTIMRVLESSDGYKLYEKYEIRGIDEPQAIEKPLLKETALTTTQKELIPTLENDKPIKVKVSDHTPTGTTKVEMNDYQPTRPADTNDALDMANDIINWLNEKPVEKSPIKRDESQGEKVRVANPKNGGTTKVEVKKYQPNRPAITNAPINIAKTFG